jgi:hypothetical protein
MPAGVVARLSAEQVLREPRLRGDTSLSRAIAVSDCERLVDPTNARAGQGVRVRMRAHTSWALAHPPEEEEEEVRR